VYSFMIVFFSERAMPSNEKEISQRRVFQQLH
jgi:hypothetical protein